MERDHCALAEAPATRARCGRPGPPQPGEAWPPLPPLPLWQLITGEPVLDSERFSAGAAAGYCLEPIVCGFRRSPFKFPA